MKEVLEYTLLLKKSKKSNSGGSSSDFNNKINAFYHLILNKIEKKI